MNRRNFIGLALSAAIAPKNLLNADCSIKEQSFASVGLVTLNDSFIPMFDGCTYYLPRKCLESVDLKTFNELKVFKRPEKKLS